VDRRTANDQSDLAGLLLARAATLDRRAHPSFIIAQAAVFYGIPVSFNEIIVSAIIGSGYAAAGAGGGVSPRKMGFTVLAWIGSLAGAIAVSYVAYVAIAAVLL